MVNQTAAIIKLGSPTKNYYFQGLLTTVMRKRQTTPQLPIPRQDSAVLNTIMGQVTQFNCSFIILDTDTDPTNGYFPSGATADELRDFLMTDIFTASGQHRFQDENGDSWDGRIDNLEIRKSGDDPIKFDATFSFLVGLTPLEN